MLTERELQEIEEREKKATKGPWHIGAGEAVDYFYGDDAIIAERDDGQPLVVATANRYYNTSQNADFIAHARTDIPALLRDVRELRGLLRESRRIFMELDINYDLRRYVGKINADYVTAQIKAIKAALEV